MQPAAFPLRPALKGVFATAPLACLAVALAFSPAQGALLQADVTPEQLHTHFSASAMVASAGLFLALIAILTTVFLAGRQSVSWGRSVKLTQPPVDRKVLLEAAVIVGQEAGRIVALVEASVGNHNVYADQLRDLESRIVSVKTAEQLRTIANLLASENHRMRRDAQNMAEQLESSQTQIENLQKRLNQAQDDSLLDGLTDVANRRAFDAVLKQSVATAAETGTPLSIAYADIDAFKSINDRFGHLTGDHVLKHFAGILSEQARSTDKVARIGGEEFAIVMPGTTSLAASVFAERVRARIAEQAFPGANGTPVDVTASFGVAQWRDGEDIDDLLGRVDGRLYRAKNLGRNRVVTT